MRYKAAGLRTRISVFVLVSVVAGATQTAFAQRIRSVEAVGMTVSDMDRSVEFFNRALSFEKSATSKSMAANTKSFIYFPSGKGDPRWQQRNGRLFLGIDHTAIVVSNTARSLKFYRDLLGFKVAGESMNHGIEQERLNNIAGARLRITGLKAERGPGVEFLEYLAPRNGRPLPNDTGANDVWHWQTTIETAGAAKVGQKLRRTSAGRLVSPGVALLPPHNSLGFKKGFLARDPDGHGLQFIER